jgi:two-component system, LytTR family, sensor kinase
MNNWIKLSKIAFFAGVIVFVIGQWIFSDGFDEPIKELLINFGIFQLYAFTLTFINIWFYDYMGKLFKFEKQAIKRIIIGFFGSLFITVIALIALRFIVVVYFYSGDPETFLNNSKGYFIFGVTITVIISLIFHLFYFYKALNERKVSESQFVAKTETAKYEVLKSQLDPHFLFNSLNVLTSLISENPALAEKFTTKLSKVYRYVLEQKNKDLITLEEELNFARIYMELLKMRFEDGIVFNIPENMSVNNYKIVPLSLQLLLENAIKHNVITSDKPLHINMVVKEGYLIIENNLNEKSTLDKGTKVGLTNIVDRYNLITRKAVEITKNKSNFIVKLPLLTQKIKKMNIDKNEETKYIRARRKVEDIKEFYTSLLSYVIIMPFLFFIWYKFTPNTIQWFWFPIFGWGIGLLFHGFKAFGTNPFLGNNWEERKIRELMKEDEKQFWE